MMCVFVYERARETWSFCIVLLLARLCHNLFSFSSLLCEEKMMYQQKQIITIELKWERNVPSTWKNMSRLLPPFTAVWFLSDDQTHTTYEALMEHHTNNTCLASKTMGMLLFCQTYTHISHFHSDIICFFFLRSIVAMVWVSKVKCSTNCFSSKKNRKIFLPCHEFFVL